MRLDKFSNPIFNQNDIFNALYTGHISKLSKIVVDPCDEITKFSNISEINLINFNLESELISIEEYDEQCQNYWFIPEEYQKIDIYNYCISKCNTDIEKIRVLAELSEYKSRNMISLLQWLIFFVDTCLKNNIVWGVGRGSSVSSYVLYLIGVHKINSIKYNLDWQDFLR